jgi:3-oxoacyl-[acyl-carrier-protein] synthase-3
MQRYGQIAGWGKYIPPKVVTNADLERMVNTSDEWIVSRTGIRERRIAGEGETTRTMSVAAARQALARAGVLPEEVDLIIVATSSPDYLLPPVSSQIQHELGCRCGAFELKAGCTGFVYGLAVAQQFIATGAYNTVLVIGAEIISRSVNWQDRNTCVLFGDGAGAVVLRAVDGPTGVLSFVLGSDGAGAGHLMVPGGGVAMPPSHRVLDEGLNFIRMNGREVFRFATRVLGRAAQEAVARSGLGPDDIALFIPHQANLRIIQVACRELGLRDEQVFINLDRYGNTSAASIPIALCEAIESGRCGDGDNLVLVGFGAGLTWAAAVVRLGAPAEPLGVADWPTAVRRVKNISWQLRRQVSAALMAALLPLYARAGKRRR